VNALWNTNAFFAYFFAVKLFKLHWERKKLLAVVIATCGVMAVIYGGSSVKPLIEESSLSSISKKVSSPLIGDSLTLVASIAYGLYQVLYKQHVTLPSDHEHGEAALYHPIPTLEDDHPPQSDPEIIPTLATSVVYPPPFGLHPNLLTSLAGITTFAILWIPIPILHYTRVELFRLPPDAKTAFVLVGIALSGVVFNAGFMVCIPSTLGCKANLCSGSPRSLGTNRC
jgi:drug/metabolite transporter (DMT)-like permease